MAQVTGKRGMIAEMNVVPYIDVMLVLLIIFMATTPLLSSGIKAELPKGPMTQEAFKGLADKNPLVFRVNAEQQMFLKRMNDPKDPKSPIDDDALIEAVRAVLAENQDLPVLVYGDSKLEYGQMVETMNLLREAGATDVILVTDPSADSGSRHH